VKLTHYRTLKALAAQHLPLQPRQPFNCSNLGGVHGVITLPKRHRFSLLSVRIFCHSQGRMRLLAEILIIAALIYVGWNTPFKQYADRANRTITSTLDGMGGSLQKHQDKSVKRY
jgi:hypothetical protein